VRKDGSALPSSGARRRAALAAALSTGALLTAGCLGTKYTYISHPSTNTYLKLPPAWHVYNEDEVVRSRALGLTPDQQSRFKKQIWQEEFDASPDPSIDHLFDPTADHPAGIVRVRKLSVADQDAISVGSLRTELLPTDPLGTAASTGTMEHVVSYTEVSRSGGYRGSHLVVTVQSSSGERVIVDQLGFIDGKAGSTYLLVLACPPACYSANHAAINRIFDSWVLKGHT